METIDVHPTHLVEMNPDMNAFRTSQITEGVVSPIKKGYLHIEKENVMEENEYGVARSIILY